VKLSTHAPAMVSLSLFDKWPIADAETKKPAGPRQIVESAPFSMTCLPRSSSTPARWFEKFISTYFFYGSYLDEKRQPTSPGGRARGKIISLLGPGFKV